MTKEQPLKILYCIDQLNIGGTERQLLSIIERLDRNFFSPYLTTLQPSDYLEKYDISCKKMTIGVRSLLSAYGIWKLFSFAKYMRREQIDIVQTFFFDSTVFGVLAGRMAGVKKIISCRRDMGFWYTPNLLRVLRIINSMTTSLQVNSFAIKDNVIQREHVHPEKIHVIYNGIDLDPFLIKHDTRTLRKKLSISKADQIVGIVANLNRPVKRVDLFLESAALVLKTHADTSFIIVGEGHLRSQLEQQADLLGIAEKIRFIGSVENVIPYLQLMDIGVLTSESEGFSNSILEYMAAGIPTVAIDRGGTGEIIQHGFNGYLVSDMDPQSIAVKVEGLLSQEKIRLQIGKVSQQQISMNYSWEKRIIELQGYYYRL